MKDRASQTPSIIHHEESFFSQIFWPRRKVKQMKYDIRLINGALIIFGFSLLLLLTSNPALNGNLLFFIVGGIVLALVRSIIHYRMELKKIAKALKKAQKGMK